MPVYLIQITPAPETKHVLIDHFPFVLGRSSSCDHQVYHPMVSRRHAELKKGDSGIAIEDLASSNGTYVNGSRVQEGAVLHDGDEINLGCISYRVAVKPSKS